MNLTILIALKYWSTWYFDWFSRVIFHWGSGFVELNKSRQSAGRHNDHVRDTICVAPNPFERSLSRNSYSSSSSLTPFTNIRAARIFINKYGGRSRLSKIRYTFINIIGRISLISRRSLMFQYSIRSSWLCIPARARRWTIRFSVVKRDWNWPGVFGRCDYSNKSPSKYWPSSKNIQMRGLEYPIFWSGQLFRKQRYAVTSDFYPRFVLTDIFPCVVYRPTDLGKGDYNTMEISTRRATARWLVSICNQTLLISFFVGVRNFVVGITVKVASDEATLRKEKTYINKLNLALVQVSATSSF